MAIEKANIFIAAASFTAANPVVVSFQNGCKIARGGAGSYTVTLDQDVGAAPSTCAVLQVTKVIAAATAADVAVTQTSSTVFTITTAATLGGASAEVAGLSLFVTVQAIGAPGTSGI
jgi:hypothetical protein